MIRTSSISRTGSVLRGTQLGGVTERKGIDTVNATEAIGSVNQVHGGVLAPGMPFPDLSRRPKLLAEVADCHSVHSSLTVASDLIKRISTRLSSIAQNFQVKNLTPEVGNEIDIDKFNIQKLVDTKLFGEYVLDSAFRPATGMADYIQCKIPGLNLYRNNLDSEQVTLVVANTLVNLHFDRMERYEDKRSRFVEMFALSNMSLDFNKEGDFIIGIPDELWRRWDGMVAVRGQGFRFAEGQPMQMPVVPVQTTVEVLLGLGIKDPAINDKLKSVEQQLADNYATVTTQVHESAEKIRVLTRRCGMLTEVRAEAMRKEFKDKPVESLSAIAFGYLGFEHHQTAINMLK